MLKDNLLKKIIKNTGVIFFGNSTASVMNLISFSIMAKATGPEFLAVFALAQTYSLLINDIFNVQTWESLVKFGSVTRTSQELFSVIKTNILLDALSALAACIFALILVLPVARILGWDETYLGLIGLYSVSILFNITTLSIGVPRLFRKFASIAKIQIAMAVIKLSAVAAVFALGKPFTFYLVVFLSIDVLTNILLILYGLLLVRTELGKGWWAGRLSINKDQIRFIWWTNLRTIIRIPVRHFDIIIVSSVLSLETLGIYKVYKEITKIVTNIADPVNQAIFPEFAGLIGVSDSRKTVVLAKKMIFLMSCVSIALTMILLVSVKYVVGTFFGYEYISHLDVLYLMLIVAGFVFSTTPINSLFIAAGFAKSSFYIVVLTNTIYLLVAFWCGSLWGLYGIVLANAVQMFLNKGLKIYMMKKHPSGWSEAAR